MKYLLIAIIFTYANVDHGASIRRNLGTFASLEECEQNRELMKSLYEDGSIWMAPNAWTDGWPVIRLFSAGS